MGHRCSRVDIVTGRFSSTVGQAAKLQSMERTPGMCRLRDAASYGDGEIKNKM